MFTKCLLTLIMLLTNYCDSSIFEFNDMAKEYLGINPGILIGYGHYCGQGSESGEPVDEIDRCCQVHDRCYGAWRGSQPPSDTYLVQYKWGMSGSKIICDKVSVREYKLCMCDRELAYCVKRSIRVFRRTNYLRHHNQRQMVIALNRIVDNLGQ